MKILIKHLMTKSPDTGSHGPFKTAAAALTLLMAACVDAPEAHADDPQSNIIPVAATTNVKAQIDQCITDAIREAKEEFGMTDAEIQQELEGLKAVCGAEVASDERILVAETRIDAANARQADATDEFIRNADARDGRSQ